MVGFYFLCFFCKFDYPDSPTGTLPRAGADRQSVSRNQDQGSIETSLYWNTGTKYNVIPDSSAQALIGEKVQQEVNYSSAIPGLPSLEPEPLNMERLLCKLAEHHVGIIEKRGWRPIIVDTPEDSAMFMDTATIANIQSIRWIR